MKHLSFLVSWVLWPLTVVVTPMLYSQATQHPLRAEHKGLTLLSSYTKSGCCQYTIENRISIANVRLNGVEVRWLSAALTTGELFHIETPSQPCIYRADLYLAALGPQVYDAADLWGVRNSVVATHRRFPSEPFDAAAYAPLARIVKEVITDLKNLPVGKLFALTSEIQSGDKKVAFTTRVRRVAENENRFEYRYSVVNATKATIHFNWLSVIDPELRKSNGLVGTVEPGGTFDSRPYQSGSPAGVNDIVLLSTTTDLSPMEDLGSQGTLADRIAGGFDDDALTRGVRDLPPGRITTLLAPVVVPVDWIK